MKVGDTIQIKQTDMGYPVGSISDKGVPTSDPVPVTLWLFATVHTVLEDGAFVEVNHPGNITHGGRTKVLRANIRTIEDVQALHDAHPLAATEQLSYQKNEHLPLINYRAAIERMKNPELIKG